MPVYNEAGTVKTIISRVITQPQVKELIIVDDGSTDGTSKILKAIKHRKLTLLHHPTNQGKGETIKTALPRVTGNYILIQDADLEYDPKEISILLTPIQERKATVVYGSRFKGSHSNMFFWHRLGNNVLNLIINILFNTTLSDMETCYKVIPTHVLKSFNLKSADFSFEPEVTCKLLKAGKIIFEVPITYAGRTYEEGKKLNWTAGLNALKTIIQERLSYE